MGDTLKTSELVMRPFSPGDEMAVNDGFNSAFNLDRSLDEWAWKFSPQPEGRLIMLAEIEGDLLAHYAGVPVRFTLDGREWNAAQIVDVFSTRAARRGFTRKGVWVRTVEAFFETFAMLEVFEVRRFVTDYFPSQLLSSGSCRARKPLFHGSSMSGGTTRCCDEWAWETNRSRSVTFAIAQTLKKIG